MERTMTGRLFERLAQWLIELGMRRPPDLEIGGSADPYLRRWYLLPRNPLLNVYLHQILRSDDDRALHDHPWLNLSLILEGGYHEVVFARPPRRGQPLPTTRVRARFEGDLILRRARAAHRLVLCEESCWSLFVTGPRLRAWGFWCRDGRWVHWRDFTAGPRGELVGRGCE
jgi:hypothetical protein